MSPVAPALHPPAPPAPAWAPLRQRFRGRLRERLPRALVALALATLPALPAWAFDVDALMQRLARHPGGQARFTETREVQGLDRPLVSHGTLSFTPPDRFERRTESPRAETMKVDGNTLVLSRGSRSRTLSLDAAPEAAALVEAIRGTLTGNRAALERLFRVGVEGTPENWTLTLGPIEAALQAQVASVQISGREAEARQVVVYLTGGDRSTMDIVPLPAAAASAASGVPSPARP